MSNKQTKKDIKKAHPDKGSKFWRAEILKCQKDPLYWYNNYCTVNGEKVTPLTQKEWDERLYLIKVRRRGITPRLSSWFDKYPLTPDDCFKKDC